VVDAEPEQLAPVLVRGEDAGVAHDDEEGLGPGDCYVEALWVGEEAQVVLPRRAEEEAAWNWAGRWWTGTAPAKGARCQGLLAALLLQCGSLAEGGAR
jgi:hypothetical protein